MLKRAINRIPEEGQQNRSKEAKGETMKAGGREKRGTATKRNREKLQKTEFD